MEGVSNENEKDRRGIARGSAGPIFSVDFRQSGLRLADQAVPPGPLDIRMRPVTAVGTLGPAETEFDLVHTMIQEFGAVANYRMYRSDNTSKLVISVETGRIAKCVQHFRENRLKIRSFGGTNLI